MPAPKGSKNAAAYQRLVTDRNANKVSMALEDLKRSGALFENITNLSRQISSRVDVSDVTLRRNERYRTMLQEYLVSQKGAANLLSPFQQDITVLRSKVKMLQLDLANRDNKIRRLEAAISRMSEGRSASEVAVDTELNEQQQDNAVSEKFVQTAHLVMALLEKIPGTIVDSKKRCIIDNYAMPGEDVIAGENLAGAFVEWFVDGNCKR